MALRRAWLLKNEQVFWYHWNQPSKNNLKRNFTKNFQFTKKSQPIIISFNFTKPVLIKVRLCLFESLTRTSNQRLRTKELLHMILQMLCNFYCSKMYIWDLCIHLILANFKETGKLPTLDRHQIQKFSRSNRIYDNC